MALPGMETSVPAGMVTPFENVNGTNASRDNEARAPRSVVSNWEAGEGKPTNHRLCYPFAESHAQNCLICASYQFRLLSSLLPPPQPRPLGEGVRYIQDGKGDDTILL